MCHMSLTYLHEEEQNYQPMTHIQDEKSLRMSYLKHDKIVKVFKIMYHNPNSVCCIFIPISVIGIGIIVMIVKIPVGVCNISTFKIASPRSGS